MRSSARRWRGDFAAKKPARNRITIPRSTLRSPLLGVGMCILSLSFRSTIDCTLCMKQQTQSAWVSPCQLDRDSAFLGWISSPPTTHLLMERDARRTRGRASTSILLLGSFIVAPNALWSNQIRTAVSRFPPSGPRAHGSLGAYPTFTVARTGCETDLAESGERESKTTAARLAHAAAVASPIAPPTEIAGGFRVLSQNPGLSHVLARTTHRGGARWSPGEFQSHRIIRKQAEACTLTFAPPLLEYRLQPAS